MNQLSLKLSHEDVHDQTRHNHKAMTAMAPRSVRPKPSMATCVMQPAPVGLAVCRTSDCEKVVVALTDVPGALEDAVGDVAFSTKTCGL